jgi:protein SCO1
MVLFQSEVVCQSITNKNNFVALFALLAVLLASCHGEMKEERLPFYNSADFTAEWIEKDDAKYGAIHTVDTFAMHNQMGNLITQDSLLGKIYVANFFFTACPSICPKMVNNLQILQDTFVTNKEIRLVSFSVTPWVDSVSRLKEYGETHKINPRKWHLLTGNKERIYTLGRKSYFAEKKLGLGKEDNAFLHTESMILIDKKARIRGIYNATEKTDIERITQDIATLLRE